MVVGIQSVQILIKSSSFLNTNLSFLIQSPPIVVDTQSVYLDLLPVQGSFVQACHLV